MRQGIIMIIIVISSFTLLTACGNKDKEHDKHNHVYKVVIDPGHGGIDKGTTGADGRYEEEFTLDLGKKVENMLKKQPSIKVYMTRDDDTFISQKSRYRPKYANKKDADLYISLHENTFDEPDVSGTQSFYYHRNSRRFAEVMQKHVAKATGFRDRGVKKKDLFVCKDTKMPAVLIEEGYISNPQDEDKMNKEKFQNQVAASIVDGIKEYRKESKKQGIWKWLF